ncbi:hypothetical protein Tco_0614060 [Tanacetum coccineum]
MKREGKDFSGRTPIISQPSSSKPQKKKSRRKQRKDSAPTEPTAEETPDEAHVSTPSYDPSQSGEDRMQLHELMNLCTKLSDRVLALETTKSNQALEIESLKRRVKSLEKRKKSRTSWFKRLRKVGLASRVESSNDASLGAQEDASKQGRKIADLDADAEVTLVDETQEMNDDNLMFDTCVLEEQEKDVAKKEVSVADLVTTAGEVVTTANVEVTTVNAPTTTIDELTLAQTLIEIKAAKPKAVTSAAKDKCKGIMVEPEVTLKKKDQVALDEEIARNLEAQLQAELIKEERLSRTLGEEKKTLCSIKSSREKEQATNLGTKEKSNEMFDKEMKRVNTFVDMNSKLVKGSKTKAEGSSKRAGDELEQEKTTKQKGDDNQEEAEMKRHIKIVKDDEVAIDAIPLATKPPMIVEYKIVKKG